MSGIVTRSASIPLATSSSVSRRTCRSAPPPEKGDWTAATRTRGALTRRGFRASRRRHATDHGVVLRPEEHRVQPRVVLRALFEPLRVGKGREELDAELAESR